MSHILVIDDDLVLELLQTTLEEDGYEVRTAEDGEKGLRLLREQAVDVVVIDIVNAQQGGDRDDH